MTDYQRGSVSIITSAEELAHGRYRGCVSFADGKNECSRHTCKQCRANPLEAQEDAEADVEYAYRHYLAELIVWHSGTGSSGH